MVTLFCENLYSHIIFKNVIYKQEENSDSALIMYFKPLILPTYVFSCTYYSYCLFKPEDQLFMAEDVDMPTSTSGSDNGINNYYHYNGDLYLYDIQCVGCLHILVDTSILHDDHEHCRGHLLHINPPDMLPRSGFVCIYQSHCSLSPMCIVAVFALLMGKIELNSCLKKNTIQVLM
jgi:hypothetical protein